MAGRTMAMCALALGVGCAPLPPGLCVPEWQDSGWYWAEVYEVCIRSGRTSDVCETHVHFEYRRTCMLLGR